jgi:hypothetical protein
MEQACGVQSDSEEADIEYIVMPGWQLFPTQQEQTQLVLERVALSAAVSATRQTP